MDWVEKNHRLLAARPVGADGVVVAVEIVEGRVGQPGLVEVQGIDLAVQLVLDGFHVVEHAVVGGLGNGQHPRLDRFIGDEGVGGDLLLDAFPVELAARDRADDAEVVAGRHQEDRNGAGSS